MTKLLNYLDKFSNDFMIFGVEDIINDIHRDHRTEVLKLLENNVHISTYYYWLEGKTPIPLKYIRLFKEFDSDIMDKVYEKFDFISSKRKKCFLPKKIDKKLSYLIGALHGDGSLDKTRRYVTVTCESKEYLKSVLKPKFKEIFGYDGNIFDMDRGKYYRLVIGNRGINFFFSLFCPVGKKKGRIIIPEYIFKNKKLLINYLSGLFDTDGSLPHIEKRKIKPFFVFVQADRNFVKSVSLALNKLDIRNKVTEFLSPSKPGEKTRTLLEWKIYIGSKKILRDFLIKIPFSHPLKKQRRKILLETL